MPTATVKRFLVLRAQVLFCLYACACVLSDVLRVADFVHTTAMSERFGLDGCMSCSVDGRFVCVVVGAVELKLTCMYFLTHVRVYVCADVIARRISFFVAVSSLDRRFSLWERDAPYVRRQMCWLVARGRRM